jgi:hypothetical protein
MNDQAVEALREAMEAPSWWTNRAHLSAREVLERLEDQGFTVTRTAAGTTNGALPVAESAAPPKLWEPEAAAAPAAPLWSPGDASAASATADAPAESAGGAQTPARRGLLGGLMADLESRVTAAREGDSAQPAEPAEEERRSA